MKKLNLSELSSYDGREGRPAYVGYKGLVYDVSESFLWKGGRHQVLHDAGKDLTEELERAPHGDDLFKRVVKIGILDEA